MVEISECLSKIKSYSYKDANMTHRFLLRGFKPSRLFDPYENWFGCSTIFSKDNSPDIAFQRDNKRIILSLQGMAFALAPPPKEITDYYDLIYATKPLIPPPMSKFVKGYFTLVNNTKIRYLAFFTGDDAKYVTWSGVLPDNEFIEDFIC